MTSAASITRPPSQRRVPQRGTSRPKCHTEDQTVLRRPNRHRRIPSVASGDRHPRQRARSGMGSLVVGIAALALILVRQLRARPLESGLVLILVLAVLGLAETGAFLYGQQQLVTFLKG